MWIVSLLLFVDWINKVTCNK